MSYPQAAGLVQGWLQPTLASESESGKSDICVQTNGVNRIAGWDSCGDRGKQGWSTNPPTLLTNPTLVIHKKRPASVADLKACEVAHA